MKNQKVKNYAKQKGVRLWQVADCLGIADTSFSRKLRYPLDEGTEEKIMSIIDEISKGQGN